MSVAYKQQHHLDFSHQLPVMFSKGSIQLREFHNASLGADSVMNEVTKEFV